MLTRPLLLALLALTLAGCGPFVNPNPMRPATAGPLGGIQDTGIGANHMERIDSK